MLLSSLSLCLLLVAIGCIRIAGGNRKTPWWTASVNSTTGRKKHEIPAKVKVKVNGIKDYNGNNTRPNIVLIVVDDIGE